MMLASGWIEVKVEVEVEVEVKAEVEVKVEDEVKDEDGFVVLGWFGLCA